LEIAMRKMFSRVQALGEKAAQLKKALDAAPAQAAHLRQTIRMTAEQLHSVRNEVEMAVDGLRAEGDAEISAALAELNEHALTLEEAGYEMIGVDMEISPVHRLIVKLEQFEEVPEANLRLISSSHNTRPTIRALLTAISKANQIAAAVDLKYLAYRELIVHLGPIPTVRIAWKVIEEEPHAVPAPLTAAHPSTEIVAPSSFFAPRSEQPIRVVAPPPIAAPAPASAAPIPPPATHAAVPAAAPASDSWQRSALDRFKQMPTGSKYSH
jgi:hypothetical protein